jgi:hypothetical protein
LDKQCGRGKGGIAVLLFHHHLPPRVFSSPRLRSLQVFHIEVALHVCVCEQSSSAISLSHRRRRPPRIHNPYGSFNKHKPPARRNHSLAPHVCDRRQPIARQRRTLLHLQLLSIARCVPGPTNCGSVAESRLMQSRARPTLDSEQANLFSDPATNPAHLRASKPLQIWPMILETQDQRW